MATEQVKLAVIGVGAMGSLHARDILILSNTELVAVCDTNPQRAETIAQACGCKKFSDYRKMLDQTDLDGVIIATPHNGHPPISIDCLQRGYHVLTEKPIATNLADAQKMVSAYHSALNKYPALQFAIMFQMRTYGHWRKVKELIDNGDLGKLVRATWIITDWFRTQSYYDNGEWRATWAGEGGGVLLNQSSHNLDLLQWFVGMPQRLTASAALGKYHNIEVEDEVSACMEYQNGMIAHFITSTAESPGSNRLEIVGEGGKLIVEDGRLTLWKNQNSMLEQIRSAADPFEPVAHRKIAVPFTHHGKWGHDLIIENFANAILQGKPLIAPAEQGINQLHLSNAMMLSSFSGSAVDLPIDAGQYSAELASRI